jgi:hypothetical protein
MTSLGGFSIPQTENLEAHQKTQPYGVHALAWIRAVQTAA